MLNVKPLALPEVLELRPKKHGDDRGFFSETWSSTSFKDAGIELNFVQDNHSYSAEKGVLRGLHFQKPPFAQDKLVRVIRGRILDVAVDIRKDSANFGKWVCLEVSAEQWNQILVPKGFAHGFVTLTDDTEVIYKVTAPYSPECDQSVRFDDPAIGIEWPQFENGHILSNKDKIAPLLADIETGF